MKIGIDLDEVTFDFLGYFLNYYNKRFGESKKPSDIKTYKFWENGIGKDREDSVSIVNDFFRSPEAYSMPLLKAAGEVIFELSRLHDVSFITARPIWTRAQTQEQLKRALGREQDLHYSGDFHKGQGKSKLEICSDLGAKVMVDDSMDFLLECAKSGVVGLLYTQPWNREVVLNGNPKRVNDWYEVWREISKLT